MTHWLVSRHQGAIDFINSLGKEISLADLHLANPKLEEFKVIKVE